MTAPLTKAWAVVEWAGTLCLIALVLLWAAQSAARLWEGFGVFASAQVIAGLAIAYRVWLGHGK